MRKSLWFILGLVSFIISFTISLLLSFNSDYFAESIVLSIRSGIFLFGTFLLFVYSVERFVKKDVKRGVLFMLLAVILAIFSFFLLTFNPFDAALLG